MKKLYTARDIEALLAEGKDPATVIGANALLTPSARDVLRESTRTSRTTSGRAKTSSAVPPVPVIPDFQYRWTPGQDPKTPQAIQAFFTSAPIETLKARICDIGQRVWSKNYVDGNGGNITVRVGDNLVLCTPTLISKGFMKPEDICLVDLDGNQVAGARKSTSEAKTHLAIMKATNKALACVHAHPPHATAFAVAGVKPPTCMIPEAEVFLGKIGLAEYQTPGTPENARVVGELAANHQSIIMQNHGVICWGKDVEDAYWKMENTDAYCQTIWVASQLGNGLKSFGTDKLRDLIAIRQKLGMDDQRANLKECELCDNDEFRPGVVCQTAGAAPATEPTYNEDAEAVVRQVTDLILKQLQSR